MKNGNLPIHPLKADLGQGKIIHYFGLTKREYFAGLAMQATMTSHHLMEACIRTVKNTDIDVQIAIIRNSIEVADELLKQLEQ